MIIGAVKCITLYCTNKHNVLLTLLHKCKCKCNKRVQNMFGLISRELDCRHDKRERIVKISRDITIGRHFLYIHPDLVNGWIL